MIDKNIILNNKDLLQFNNFQGFFDKLDEGKRAEYAKFFYVDCNIDFLQFMNNIPNKLFYGATYLKGLTISADFIGDEAFANSSLIEIKVDSGCKSIGAGAFSRCSNLNNVVIEDGPKVLPSNIFYGCGALSKVYLPKSVTFIKKGAFANCSDSVQIITPIDRSRMERLVIPGEEKEFFKSHVRRPKMDSNAM